MKIIKTMEASGKKNPHNVDARLLYDKPNAQAVHIKLSPGQSLLPHITPTEVFFYILEGNGTVEVGDETREVETDTLIESPKGIKHRLMNSGESDFRFLVVKSPRQKTSTRLL